MDKIKILYVDSQKEYGQKYFSFLLGKEYDVKFVSSLKEALLEYSFHKSDLIITELLLSDAGGLELIQKIKKLNNDVKTFVLAQNVNQESLLEMIPLKIDKFFFKTQTFEEIDLEIKKLNINDEVIFDDKDIIYDLGENFLYEINSFHLIKSDALISLTSQENQLIKELVKAKGDCVTYKMLQNAIGKDGISTIDTLRTVIRKIRRKTYSGIIQNQSGIGYKISYYPPIDMKNEYIIDQYNHLELKVLILKVNAKKNELLSYQLNKFGFKCESAMDIEEARELLLIDSYDYIISDLNLPDGEGIDLIKNIKDLNKTKMIILSNSKDIHYKDYLYFKGVLDYIVDINDVRHLSYTLYKTILKVENNINFNNILVIEQSKRICEQIKDLLLPRNYNVDISNELNQAYEFIKSKKYSLIILDIEYEKSFEFLIDIKSNVDKSLPFIMLSDTNRTYLTVREAYKSGASECLRKPIYAEEFILKVDQLVENSKLVYELIEQKDLIESYKKIVDQSAIISKTDSKGNITYVNEMFTRISGYSQNELIGKPHSIIRHEDTPKELFDEMWYTINHKKNIWSGVITNKAKDGTSYVVQTSILPLKDSDGNILEFIALRNDITFVYKDNS